MMSVHPMRAMTGLILVSALVGQAEESVHICRQNHAGSFGIELDGDGPRYAPDRQADVLHIRLDVTPDFAERTVAGTTRIEFRPIAKALEELRLDATQLTIHDVRSDFPIDSHSNDGKHLRIRFDVPIPVDAKAYVEIDHAAQPKMGLYFRTPEMGYPATDTHLWTQGETHEASFWFPCFDYPNERSSSEIICHVPPEMLVVSNGRKLGDRIGPDGLRRVHWLQEKPHVSYLICLVAGRFEKLEKQYKDIPLGFYVQPSLAEHAANSFADTEKILEFFESEIGVPFPWNKYDQATIRDFVAGGMENTTLTTLTHRTIFTEATENLRESRRLDAHETAHQWFGDYVTCKDWGHLWLNEGFATYYTHLYEGHKFGRDAMLYGLYRDAKTRILPRKDDKRAIVYRGYKNPSEQFDYRAYPKGSWVLHMLRSQLGADLYRRAVRHYLQSNALQSVVSDDLRKAFEEVSGRPFDRFFDQWVYHPGAPDLIVKHQWDLKQKLSKITVRQRQVDQKSGRLFHFPTQVRFVVEGETIERDIQVVEKEQEFFFALPKQPTIVRFDPHLSVLANVEFKKSDPLLFAQLDQQGDMIGRLLAAEALANRDSHESVKRLKKALNSDPFFGVRIAASGSLAKIGTDEAFAALGASLKQSDARVRNAVVKDLGTFYRPQAFQHLVDIVKRESNPAIQATAIRALGSYQIGAANKLVREMLRSTSFRHMLADAAIDAIRAQKNPKHRRVVLKAIQEDASKFTPSGLASALNTLAILNRDRKDKSNARNLILKYVNDPRSTVQRGAISALGELNDPSVRPAILGFQQSKSDPRLAAAAKLAAKRLTETAPAAPKELIELRKQVFDLNIKQKSLESTLKSLTKQMSALQGSNAEKEPGDDEKASDAKD